MKMHEEATMDMFNVCTIIKTVICIKKGFSCWMHNVAVKFSSCPTLTHPKTRPYNVTEHILLPASKAECTLDELKGDVQDPKGVPTSNSFSLSFTVTM